jgi:hypothetical protein
VFGPDVFEKPEEESFSAAQVLGEPAPPAPEPEAPPAEAPPAEE